MGHLGHPLTKKRDHHCRKRDTNIEQVPHTAAKVSGTDNFDSGYYLQFESRQDIFNGILEALQDDNISHVAFYGMGGAGKTTLAKQIGKRAKELNLFNLVVFVHVLETPNVMRMQGDIADQLGLVMGEEEDDLVARQRQISLRLRNEGRVLVILDDVWERLDLQRIGILNDECGHLIGCKVLLTSRNLETGYLMGFKVSFRLYLLTEEEALLLFGKHAGIHDDENEISPDIVCLAKEVAKQCRGHPLLISVAGSALRGKTDADQWRKALDALMEYDRHHDYSVFLWGLLEWSYNSISNKVAQTLFMICALWPQYIEILSKDLSQHAIRLGLCNSRNEANAAINSLKASRLLMPSHRSKDHVIMHDLVRDVALHLVYRQNPSYKHSIKEYVDALRNEEEGFQWQKDLDSLLGQLYGGRGGEGRALQVVQPYHYTIMAPPIPKPSGKLVDFYGLCRVDKSFLPLLKEVCSTRQHLIERQRRHSEMLRQSAFECLGRVLFLLHNVTKKDLVVYHKEQLQMLWEQLKVMKFDLDWLSPAVEEVLSSAETARIEELREEENHWNTEAAKLRDQLKILENKAAAVRTETALIESKFNGFAIAEFSDVRVVSKVTPSWKKIFFKK